MRHKKIFFIFLFSIIAFLFFPISTNAQMVVDMDTNKPVNFNGNYRFETIDGHIKETGKVIGYHDGHFVTNVKGEITIENNGNHDLYSVNIPFKRNNNLNLIETTNTGYMYNDSIHIPMLMAGNSLKIRYHYIGLTLEKPDYSETNILNTAIKKDRIRMYSDIQLNLKKGPLENQSGKLRRLISVNVRNPSNFIIEAINIKITKTEPGEMDVNNESRTWRLKDTLLIPRTMMVADILDYTKQQSEIYWISADTSVASYNMTAEENINYFTEDDISGQMEQELKDQLISQEIKKEMPYKDKILLRKFVSKTQVKPNETIEVKNMIYNFEDTTKTVNLKDKIPKYFKLVDLKSNESRTPANIDKKNMSWKDININPQGARIFTYTIALNDSNKTGVQYIKGSRIDFEEGSITSENIPVILQYLPEKKLFIQKKVKILNDEEFLVEIKVENVGETTIKNLVLKEDIPEDKIFSEITKPFLKRGVWEIEKIPAKDTWKVTYVTNHEKTVQSIPLIFGLEQKSTYITLTIDNQIKSKLINKMQFSEKAGLLLTGIVAIMYIIIATRKRK